MKSPDKLRDLLTSAIRQKDIKSLEKAISETEAARYPELSAELRKARDVLETLGGGRGGQLYKLAVILIVFAFTFFDWVSFCFTGVNGFSALGTLSAETLRDQITTAMREGDRDNLEAVLMECVSAGLPELDSSIHRARSKLKDMEDAPKLGGHFTIKLTRTPCVSIYWLSIVLSVFLTYCCMVVFCR